METLNFQFSIFNFQLLKREPFRLPRVQQVPSVFSSRKPSTDFTSHFTVNTGEADKGNTTGCYTRITGFTLNSASRSTLEVIFFFRETFSSVLERMKRYKETPQANAKL